ncbi:hypothetical protein CY34DRAFT_807748 [Suillus luteus UH-Slu-Lm8-n1]|uniref:Unplaced genomic scaffold CY34scaffold_193, whole genome shotgun sequence n=1 Tax=Suillus luteus UH-Slu-Lm8-n1 TaxID=930992 RepID=A0A0C9ZQB6_9AGAM|nr:hypothetical protein CY34DRAFT_807748 [Suillus luteus UH-Slu-Lm8-n1]
MSEHNQSRNLRQDSPPKNRAFSEATAGGSSGRRRGKIHQFLGMVKNATKNISHSNVSRSCDPVLQNIDFEGASSISNIKVQHTLSGVEQDVDPQSALQNAKEAVQLMKPPSGHMTSGASTAQNASADLETAFNFQDTYLQPLRIFDSVIGTLADVHPYAKIALGVLSCASKMVIAQSDRDQAVHRLVDKLDRVYGFLIQDEMLDQISSMRGILGQISQQTLECARFIRDYAETKSFWKRLGKDILTETNSEIQQYSDALDALVQNFRDQVARDVVIYTHHTGELLDLSGITYAENAGLDTRKQCLQGTRTEILSQITDWVNSTEDDAPRVLWLSGPAGKGKSAIAHTIANWFSNAGGLGSCYCFDRDREADRRHEKIFSTIARDLADRDSGVRRALADTVQHASALKTTADIIQQWQKLLMEPLQKLSKSTMGPVVIVIDALDESGTAKTRCDLLRILSGKVQNSSVPQITELPKNFRFIVTSRPLRDIQNVFAGVQHIRRISMDDIPPEVAERDIYAYVSKQLEGLSQFGSKEFTALAKKADGLFEWARLACESIEAPPPGLSSYQSHNVMVSRDPVKREHLLYDMYDFILTEIMRKNKRTNPEFHQTQLATFRSVMGQILGTAEPLPLNSLNAMRSHFLDESERYEVDVIVEHMGSLLSGTTNSSTPIRPLHTSFRDFLMDQSHSGEFFVDVSKVQHELAFASLRVMQHGLAFNICDLKSSYLPNSEVPGLRERTEKCIAPHLSYACRFWPVHVQSTQFDPELAKEIQSFFGYERLFFWLEVLGLTNALSGAVPALPLIAKWLKGHTEYEDTSSAAIDVQRFIQVFGGLILHSTPHLYVSALPFSPVNTALFRIFSARFPNSLRLASGHDKKWKAIQTVISGHADGVNSVSFSPDGTRIATGSADCTVRLWDAVTGQPIGKPLLGHTSPVYSVSFSPDGTRIVSGSADETVRLWDAATGQPVGEPLEGHIDEVNSVSFSPNGTRIVTCSDDWTVRLWDAATGQPVGEPLVGHTSYVYSVSFSPDGTRIVSGSGDKTVRLWDAVTRQPVGEPLRGHTSSVTSVSFSPDGTRIVSGSGDETVRLWDVARGRPVCGPLVEHSRWVRSVSFSPDGSRIVTSSDDWTVQLWDAATGQPVGKPLLGHTNCVYSVAFSPDGTRIVSASSDNTIRLWDTATGQSDGEPLRGHTNSIISVSLSPDGTRIAIVSRDCTVRLLDAATGEPVGEPLEGHTNEVNSVSFSPDGTRIVTGSDDWTVRLWDAATGQPVGGPMLGHTGYVYSVSFSPDGTRIVSGSDDNTVRLWDAGTGQAVGEPLRGHTSYVYSVSLSPDGTRIATGSADCTVRLWDAATGQPVGKPWLRHNGYVYSVSFSPDGTRIVSGSSDKTVRLWDVATGQPVSGPLRGHTSSVTSVSFSPDGICIVSGSGDETVRLWDAATGEPIGKPLQGHTSCVNSVAFSRDGTRIISCSQDGTVRVWYTVIRKSLQDHAEEDCLPSSAHGSCTPYPIVAIPTHNTMNGNFICFSSNSTHTLCNPAELLAGTPCDDHTFSLGVDGWVLGPNHRLLFWVPPASREAFRYNSRVALVIGTGCVELDLSRMAHGTRWQHCYE